jgi:hypothetical protein
MAYLSAHGTMKPPLGAQLDPAHPFAQNTVLCLPFTEGFGALPGLLPATGIVGTARPPIVLAGVVGTPTWTSTSEGIAGAATTTSAWELTTTDNWLPTAQVTVLLVRRKRDATLRTARVIEADQGATAFWILAPWSDGTVYWDFGGNGGANRLTAAGLTFSLTRPDRWVFTAGARGSTIWQNGVKVASQTTAITRSSIDHPLYLNGDGNGANGENADYNFFQIINDQWSDDLCRWWSAESYAHLYPRPMTFIGSSKGKGKLPAAVVAAAAAAQASATTLTGPTLSGVG